jgi:hypothetical protein
MLIMERLIVLYDSCMILFVAFCIVVCNHMLTLQMPLSFFILLWKLNDSQIWLVLKLFKNLGEDIFNLEDLRWANAISRQNCLHLKTKLPTFHDLKHDLGILKFLVLFSPNFIWPELTSNSQTHHEEWMVRWNRISTHLMFIHNWVIIASSGQWFLWWVLVHSVPSCGS